MEKRKPYKNAIRGRAAPVVSLNQTQKGSVVITKVDEELARFHGLNYFYFWRQELGIFLEPFIHKGFGICDITSGSFLHLHSSSLKCYKDVAPI